MTLHDSFPVPPERVYDALTDLPNAGRWMPGFVRAELLTPGNLGVGAQWRETRKLMGREASEVFEVRELVPPSRIRLFVDGSKGSSKRGYYDFTYTLAADGNGTRLQLDCEMGGMGWLGALLAPLMKGMFRKSIAKDHDALRQYLAGQ